MKKFTDQVKTALLKSANDINFYGKRKRDSKLQAIESLKEFASFEASKLVDWLDENKPVKTTASRTVSNKLAHDTLNGAMSGHTDITRQGNKRAYIVTSAQNNTEVNREFLKALKLYASTLNAEILISGFTYNKTAYQADRDSKNGSVHYAIEIQPYIVNEPVQLFDNLVYAGELDIIPTATRPTNGHTGYHGENSLIIGHTKVELQSLATAQNETPKFIYSTGCCTLKNYRQQRAGQRAEKTHSLSALVVEVADTAQGWQARQVHWNGSSFYDLNSKVTPLEVLEAEPASAITMGDIHADKIDQEALSDAINLALLVKAKNVFLHDLHDFTSRNHHNRNDHFFIASQGQQTVNDDLLLTGEVLNAICTGAYTADNVYIVRSNHDEALDNWLKAPDYDFRRDPLNARLYLDLQSTAYGYIERAESVPDMMEIALNVAKVDISEKAIFLTRKDTIKIDGVILSDHGDCGSNGSRATPQQLAKTYNKMSSGHTHTAFIFDGQYVSGVTGSLQMGYNERGASSWSHSHTVQYVDGNRAIITF